jgi:hypothetical protein
MLHSAEKHNSESALFNVLLANKRLQILPFAFDIAVCG